MMYFGLLLWFLSSLLVQVPTWALTGPNVCHSVVNYTVTSREQYEEPVEILTLDWCLQIPPRCPVTRTELRQRWRMKNELKFKSVPVCCDGYVMQEVVGAGSADAKCVPRCERCPPTRGTCVAPNQCTCEPGFLGQDCSSECPAGKWGKSCEQECNCVSELGCDPRDGRCDCPPGWTGPRCESKCPDGQWGRSCSAICVCDANSATAALCHHETGECATTTASATTTTTTTTTATTTTTTRAAPVPRLVTNIDLYEASGNVVPSKSGDFVDVIDFDTVEADLADDDESGPRLPDDMIPVSVPTTTTRRSVITTSTSTTEGNQLSQPELDRDFGNEQQLQQLHHQQQQQQQQQGGGSNDNFRVIVSPKTEYVKTSHQGAGPESSMPMDMAAVIVVGALVSIGLTSVAAVMIFHVRSRLLKVALSIYSDQEKIERQCSDKELHTSPPLPPTPLPLPLVFSNPGPAAQVPTAATSTTGLTCKSAATASGLDVTIGTLPRGTMTRHNPMYANSETLDSVVSLRDNAGLQQAQDEGAANVEYANGTVTIGIRLSSNLRDLLEGHYDRPAPIAQPEDHLYDEIPSQLTAVSPAVTGEADRHKFTT